MKSSERPALVTLVGWAFVLVSLFMLLTGAMGIGAVLFVESASREGIPESFEGAPGMFFVSLVFIRQFGALAVLQMAVAALVLVFAVKFVRLRAWARSALEAFTWLSLLGMLVIGVLVVHSWMKMTADMSPAMTAPLSAEAFTLVGAVLWAALDFVLAACAVFLLAALRSRTVREAVS